MPARLFARRQASMPWGDLGSIAIGETKQNGGHANRSEITKTQFVLHRQPRFRQKPRACLQQIIDVILDARGRGATPRRGGKVAERRQTGMLDITSMICCRQGPWLLWRNLRLAISIRIGLGESRRR